MEGIVTYNSRGRDACVTQRGDGMAGWTDVVAEFLDRRFLVLVVLGVICLILGASNGISFAKFTLLVNETGQWALYGAGALLTIAALVTKSSSSEPNPSRYGVKITYPQHMEQVDIVDVRGIIKKRPPSDYTLVALRQYSGRYLTIYPMSEAGFSEDGKSWTAPACNIGGSTGDSRTIGIYLVGPSGRALIRYFKDAEAVHGRALAQVWQSVSEEARTLPLITDLTADMVKCAEVLVKRK